MAVSGAAAPAGRDGAPRPAAGEPAGAGDLVTRRLVVVTGKGGVGKSTVAAALAIAAARRGRRAIVAEVAGRSDVPRTLGATPGRPYAEHEVATGVDHVSIDPRHALREHLRRQLPPGAAAVLLAGGAFDLLTAAAPGLAELLTVGKAWDLAQPAGRGRRRRRPHDLVILDAPSTGHGVALLRAPATFAAVGGHGPVAAQAQAIDAFLRSRGTAVVAVAAAEQLAVAETLELVAALREQVHLPLRRVIVDGLLPDRFSAHEERAVGALPPSPARRAARFAAARARRQRDQLAELRAGLGDVPVTTLPFVFAPALRRADLERLARLLER